MPARERPAASGKRPGILGTWKRKLAAAGLAVSVLGAVAVDRWLAHTGRVIKEETGRAAKAGVPYAGEWGKASQKYGRLPVNAQMLISGFVDEFKKEGVTFQDVLVGLGTNMGTEGRAETKELQARLAWQEKRGDTKGAAKTRRLLKITREFETFLAAVPPSERAAILVVLKAVDRYHQKPE